jgi:hypothetical protein
MAKLQALAAGLLGFAFGCAIIKLGGGAPRPDAVNMAGMVPTPTSAMQKPTHLRMPARAWQRPQSAARDEVPPAEIELDLPGDVQQGRREVMTGLGFAAAGVILNQKQAAQAAYGDGANVFGTVTNNKGVIAYAGEGFSLLLPAKWNPSKENEFAGGILRYEDNGDAVNSLVVIKLAGQSLGGTPEEFLNKNSYLLGQQSYAGSTISEGGFAADRVSAASVLDISDEKDKQGRRVFGYNILSRTADGNEGGRHQLIKALEAKGSLYILKVQIGDKRWFKGARNEAEACYNSFTIA